MTETFLMQRDTIMKNIPKAIQKITLLALLIAGITLLHYSTNQSHNHFQVFYGELYLLPIVLAAFWFGLRGALLVSTTITVCYLPFMLLNWQDFSKNDLDSILSLLLYNSLAILVGTLKNHQAKAREEVLQTESLAVMGRSLAAAAHDMRTPVVLIGGLARQLLKQNNHKNPDRLKLELIIKEADKMEKMTGDMLNFSKPLTLNLIRKNFSTTIQNSLLRIKEVARRHNVSIKYKSDPAAEVVDIHYDSLRFEQVIVNLVLNAIEASTEGDTVTVTLSLTSFGNAILDVTDNGNGILFTQRQKLFAPFFTTKKDGTGLGLPIVHKIVMAHGWSLQIMDNASGGTIFRITLKESIFN